MLDLDILITLFKNGPENDAAYQIDDLYTHFPPNPVKPGELPNEVFPLLDDCPISDWNLVNSAGDTGKVFLVVEACGALNNSNDTQVRLIDLREQQVMFTYENRLLIMPKSVPVLVWFVWGERSGP